MLRNGCMEMHVWMKFNWWCDYISLPSLSPSSSSSTSSSLQIAYTYTYRCLRQIYACIGMQWNESNRNESKLGYCPTDVSLLDIVIAIILIIIIIIVNKLWIDGRKLVLQQSGYIKMQITFMHIHSTAQAIGNGQSLANCIRLKNDA